MKATYVAAASALALLGLSACASMNGEGGSSSAASASDASQTASTSGGPSGSAGGSAGGSDALAGAATIAGTPLTSLKPTDVPKGAAVMTADNQSLGRVTKILVDGKTGNVSSIVVTPQGATKGKKVPASQATVVGGQLTLAIDKTAFNALPSAS